MASIHTNKRYFSAYFLADIVAKYSMSISSH
ncbi:hypothetical protein EMIT0P291_110057 [Pseudomonas sp. IT-P291]